MSVSLFSEAVVFEKPGKLTLRQVALEAPKDSHVTVDVLTTGISSGTEKLLWNGTMPPFPGLAYPLVPGYEAVGVISETGAACSSKVGTQVFVPGADCYAGDLRGLFGASASRLHVPEDRVIPIPQMAPEQGVLLALAATAMHILTYQYRQRHPQTEPQLAELVDDAPQLIVGHGVLGRLLARLCLAIGAEAPCVWELDERRRTGAQGYELIAPDDDQTPMRQHIVDVSGACGNHFNDLIRRLSKGGKLTLAGFYQTPVNFDFAPAFMREISIGIAAEWQAHDLSLVQQLIAASALNLDGLVSHEFSYDQAADAYPQAFNDPSCLKTILKWSAL
ncbi:MAG: chlorophyll synthesis pathway protein BchC [Granulosicoccus sp.]|nr:chlorophyll synthesis pathway protein BchC [Granulosicoccus sp.]